VGLSHGGRICELESFQQYFPNKYKFVVYIGLKCGLIMYEGQVDATKIINLFYDEEKHHVINNLVGAFTKRYVCKECNKSCTSDVTRV
jgi:hypothetical protein